MPPKAKQRVRIRASSTPLTAEKRRKFLAALTEHGNVSWAALQAGKTRQCFYEHREKDAAFAKQWDDALELGIAAMEDEVVRRAVQGVDEPVFYRGEQVGSVKRYSDLLLIFMLKARRPERYRDQSSRGGWPPHATPQEPGAVIILPSNGREVAPVTTGAS